MVFLACVHLALFLALFLSPGRRGVTIVYASFLALTVSNSSLFLLSFVKNPLICFLCCPRNPLNLSQSFLLQGSRPVPLYDTIRYEMFFNVRSKADMSHECPAFTAVRCTGHTSAFISCTCIFASSAHFTRSILIRPHHMHLVQRCGLLLQL